ncbi:metallophosphoesterase [Thiomicrorhabdus sp. 6S3-12]|uniref:metallophosphoesterase n=1 Tax=Thiomicrorhabdus sp. 6S3-12 TaxID=2819681 RepID=UPI001AAD04EE|nr:metallophosphoesterase [Thiomicrorhabdus sp. 6S3-12]MBO1923092.1 metallophosphoesterase [Thiomicrorhabdus sp. 6S3-12]
MNALTESWSTTGEFNHPHGWQTPQKEIYFFCDLHADADALLNSLKLSGLIEQRSTHETLYLSPGAENAQILIGGDCFDKGPSNLALFRLLNKLRAQHPDLVLLSGNHDLRVYAGLLATNHLDDLRQAHFFVRMGRKTAAFFAEIFEQYCRDEKIASIPQSLIEAQLMPDEQWFELFPQYACNFMSAKQLKKELKQIRKKKQDFIEAWNSYGYDWNQLMMAVTTAKQLFIEQDGEFFWFFQNLQLMQRHGSYLFCHAGIDDRIAHRLLKEPVEDINQQFNQALQLGKIFEIYYSELGNVVRTKYRNKDWAFSELGAQALKNQGIYALVNGHRAHHDGQQLIIRQGILHFECDTELNANCRAKSNLPANGQAVTIFSSDGTVQALSNDLTAPKRFHPSRFTNPNVRFN